MSPLNRLSQLNVLSQLDNLKTYPVVQERLRAKRLRLHAWWFELKGADVHAYDVETDTFRILEGEFAESILESLTTTGQNNARQRATEQDGAGASAVEMPLGFGTVTAMPPVTATATPGDAGQSDPYCQRRESREPKDPQEEDFCQCGQPGHVTELAAFTGATHHPCGMGTSAD